MLTTDVAICRRRPPAAARNARLPRVAAAMPPRRRRRRRHMPSPRRRRFACFHAVARRVAAVSPNADIRYLLLEHDIMLTCLLNAMNMKE